MEQAVTITDLINNVGFPIFCVLALGFFIYKSYQHITSANENREEKLYTMLGKSQEQLDRLEDTNEGFVKVLESFKKDQDDIRHDIEDIKEDIKAIPKRASDYVVVDNKRAKRKEKVEEDE